LAFIVARCLRLQACRNDGTDTRTIQAGGGKVFKTLVLFSSSV
jgi:hypothetical protein